MTGLLPSRRSSSPGAVESTISNGPPCRSSACGSGLTRRSAFSATRMPRFGSVRSSCPGSGSAPVATSCVKPVLGPWLASFGAAALLFNPVFFMMTATFMTDVPALSFSLLALACYQRGFADRGRWWFQAAGCLAAILAGVTRQNALAVPVVAGILLLQRPSLEWKAVSWAAVVLPAVACLATAAWFSRQDGVILYSPLAPDRNRVLILTVPLLITMGLAGLPAALMISLVVAGRSSRLAPSVWVRRHGSAIVVWDRSGSWAQSSRTSGTC